MISADESYRAAAHHLNAGRDEDMFLDYLTEDAKNVLWNRLARERLKIDAVRKKNGEIIFAVPGPMETEVATARIEELMRVSAPLQIVPDPPSPAPIQTSPAPLHFAPDPSSPGGFLVFAEPAEPTPPPFLHVLRISMDGTCYVHEKKCENDHEVLEGLRMFLLTCWPALLPTPEHSIQISSGAGSETHKGGDATLSAPWTTDGRNRFVAAFRHLQQIASAAP